MHLICFTPSNIKCCIHTCMHLICCTPSNIKCCIHTCMQLICCTPSNIKCCIHTCMQLICCIPSDLKCCIYTCMQLICWGIYSYFSGSYEYRCSFNTDCFLTAYSTNSLQWHRLMVSLTLGQDNDLFSVK